MGQDDIFKLLLMILLLTNEKENCPDGCNRPGLFSNLNEIIIISLLLGACGSGNNGDRDRRAFDRDSRDLSCDRDRRDLDRD